MKLKFLIPLLIMSSSAFAISDPPPPGPTVTDIANAIGYVNSAIVALGLLVSLVLGGFFAFWLIRKTMVWSRAIGGNGSLNDNIETAEDAIKVAEL